MSTKGNEIVSILGKGLVGAIPFIGPLAAEIVGAVIPNQRMDRIESILRLLESKIGDGERGIVEGNIASPESVDLIEDSFIQASRALSEERKDYIASLLKNSLTKDDLKHIEHKRLFTLLAELNDLEILILKSYTMNRRVEEHNEFWEQHENVLISPIACLGHSQKEIDKRTIFQTHSIHLVNMGLLCQKFKKQKRGELPELDEKTGMLKAQGYEITPLGRLLLKNIDQGGEL